jgi:hypothetical protein
MERLFLNDGIKKTEICSNNVFHDFSELLREKRFSKMSDTVEKPNLDCFRYEVTDENGNMIEFSFWILK